MSKVRVYQKTVTPEMATKYLSNNEGNRKITEKNISFFYQQMLSGSWKITADPIKFNDSGKLIDGQHRLKALIKYGKPVDLFIAEGLNDDVFSVIDTGRNRSSADILSIKGYKSFNALSGMVKSIIMFKNGCYGDSTKISKDYRATNQAVLEFVEKNPSLQEDLNYCNGIYRQFRYLPISKLGMLYYILQKRDAERVDSFFEKYATGIDLSETSPIRLLRDRFIRDSQNKTKLSNKDMIALFIFAWNAFIQNKKMEVLKLSKDYIFPKPL